MSPRQRRTLFIVGGLLSIGIATFFILKAFNQNLVFFYTPSQIANHEIPQDKNFRIGGMVVQKSVEREPGGLKVRFVVTDLVHNVPVTYNGILPDLFKEGKGVVAQGALDKDGVFIASQVLAKHDENYMPPEAKSALEAGKNHSEAISKNVHMDGK